MGAHKDFAVEGGLQPHSVGDTFPYSVQAYENPVFGTRYVIFDATQGKYHGYITKTNPQGQFFEWPNALQANEVLARRFADGMKVPTFLTNFLAVVWLPFSHIHFHKDTDQ